MSARSRSRPWFKDLRFGDAFARLLDAVHSYNWLSTRPARYFNKRGEPISMLEWTILYEDEAYRVVEQTPLDGDAHMSTVWLGLDHGFPFGEPRLPVIFQTMDFPEQRIQERYATEEQARIGHRELVVGWLRRAGAPRPGE